jgi:hypothetical protein
MYKAVSVTKIEVFFSASDTTTNVVHRCTTFAFRPLLSGTLLTRKAVRADRFTTEHPVSRVCLRSVIWRTAKQSNKKCPETWIDKLIFEYAPDLFQHELFHFTNILQHLLPVFFLAYLALNLNFF